MNSQMLTQSYIQTAEQRLVLEGISWQQYEIILATLGDDFPNLRLNYLEGALELATNSPEHEELKKVIGMLLEAYFQETGTRFHALGSTTFRKAMKLRGLEPDECYCLGAKKEFPDLAIEVVLTSSIVNKLEIYQGLGVAEVWQWREGQFVIRHLRSTGYEQIPRSELLPNLDIQLLARHVNPTEQFDTVMVFRDTIRQR
jgi:Uma2 family endonuclease